MNGKIQMNDLITNDNWSYIKTELLTKPDQSTKLLSVETLNACMEKIENNIKPLTEKEAKSATEFLMSCYPEVKLVNSATYIEVVRATIQDYPHFIVKKSIEEITKKHKYIPNRAVIYEECEKLMKEPRSCLQHAKKQIELHKKRKEQEEEVQKIKDSWKGTSPEKITKKINEKYKIMKKM